MRTLTDKIEAQERRLWDAAQAVEHGWSRNVLEHHIGTQMHTRVDRSPTPTQILVGPVDSDLVRDLVKDPYRLDFLELDAAHCERQLETAMAHRMTALLAELGPGFAFVGRKVPLRVGESDFYLDLLSGDLQLRRFVVVELKTNKATPEAKHSPNRYAPSCPHQKRSPTPSPATSRQRRTRPAVGARSWQQP